MKMLISLSIVFLTGCEHTAVVGVPMATTTPKTQLYTVMQPLCILLCSNPVSVIREDVFTAGSNTNTATGAKSNTQSGSFAGGSRNTDIN
jgi:hypothetical protein